MKAISQHLVVSLDKLSMALAAPAGKSSGGVGVVITGANGDVDSGGSLEMKSDMAFYGGEALHGPEPVEIRPFGGGAVVGWGVLVTLIARMVVGGKRSCADSC